MDRVTALKPANLPEISSRIEQTLQHRSAFMPRLCAAPDVLWALTNKHKVLMLLLKEYVMLETERLEIQAEHPFTMKM